MSARSHELVFDVIQTIGNDLLTVTEIFEKISAFQGPNIRQAIYRVLGAGHDKGYFYFEEEEIPGGRPVARWGFSPVPYAKPDKKVFVAPEVKVVGNVRQQEAWLRYEEFLIFTENDPYISMKNLVKKLGCSTETVTRAAALFEIKGEVSRHLRHFCWDPPYTHKQRMFLRKAARDNIYDALKAGGDPVKVREAFGMSDQNFQPIYTLYLVKNNIGIAPRWVKSKLPPLYASLVSQ